MFGVCLCVCVSLCLYVSVSGLYVCLYVFLYVSVSVSGSGSGSVSLCMCVSCISCKAFYSSLHFYDTWYVIITDNELAIALQDITKYLLVTWVPDAVSPLKRARTGSHRVELAQFIGGRKLLFSVICSTFLIGTTYVLNLVLLFMSQ